MSLSLTYVREHGARYNDRPILTLLAVGALIFVFWLGVCAEAWHGTVLIEDQAQISYDQGYAAGERHVMGVDQAQFTKMKDHGLCGYAKLACK